MLGLLPIGFYWDQQSPLSLTSANNLHASKDSYYTGAESILTKAKYTPMSLKSVKLMGEQSVGYLQGDQMLE